MEDLKRENNFLKKKIAEFQEIFEKQKERVESLIKAHDEDMLRASQYVWCIAKRSGGQISVSDAELTEAGSSPENNLVSLYNVEDKTTVFTAKTER